MPDAVHNTFERFEDLVVPEPQDPVTMPGESSRSLIVVNCGLAMLTTIKFNHQLRRMACEVGNKPGNRNLPAKMPPFRLQLPQLLPQHALGRRGIGTEGSRKPVCHSQPPTPAPPHEGEGNFIGHRNHCVNKGPPPPCGEG